MADVNMGDEQVHPPTSRHGRGLIVSWQDSSLHTQAAAAASTDGGLPQLKSEPDGGQPLVDKSARSSPRPAGVLPAGAIPFPTAPTPHGAPTRVYLNQKITPHLLDGMKWLALNEYVGESCHCPAGCLLLAALVYAVADAWCCRPDKPLKWLSEFLAQRSQEVEAD